MDECHRIAPKVNTDSLTMIISFALAVNSIESKTLNLPHFPIDSLSRLARLWVSRIRVILNLPHFPIDVESSPFPHWQSVEIGSIMGKWNFFYHLCTFFFRIAIPKWKGMRWLVEYIQWINCSVTTLNCPLFEQWWSSLAFHPNHRLLDLCHYRIEGRRTRMYIDVNIWEFFFILTLTFEK